MHTLPPTREELPHDEHLQTRHRDHQTTLHQTEVEDPLLRTPDRAEIPVLPRAEVLLLPSQSADLAVQLEY